MVVGSPLYSHKILQELGRVFGMRVFAAKYPLCPDVAAAEAVNAGVEAYMHIVDDLKVDPKRVIILGESGGGQMTLLVCQALANRGLPLPASAFVMSPVCDHSDETIRARRDTTMDLMLGDPATMDVVHDHLRRVGKPDEVPLCHASYNPYCGTVVGLPPTYFLYDAGELFAFEAGRMVRKMREAGVPVAERTTKFGMHGGPLVSDCPEAKEEFSRAAQWTKQFLAQSQ